MSGVTKKEALAIRKQIKALMAETAADHNRWTYEAVRPAPMPPKPWHPGMAVVGDCSKGCQYLAYWADAPDPMHNGFSSIGNSTTLWLNLPHIDRDDIDVGDIVVFGPDHHACMIFSLDPDPEVWNFGTQGQPVITTLSREVAGHRGMDYWFCALLPKGVGPSPEKIRSSTGFYAWVAWKLGEGPWKPYGPADNAMRPAVPRRIPVGWWTRYRSFLRNRRRGNKATSLPA